MVQNLKRTRFPCSTLVQSSGTGKSRLVKELAKTLPILYVGMGDDSSPSYPPRSKCMTFFDSLNKYEDIRSISHIMRNSLFLAIRDFTKFWREQECNVRGETLERAWKFQEGSTDFQEGSPGFFKEEFIEESMSSPLSENQMDEIWHTFCEVTEEKPKETGNQSPVKIMLVFDEARYLSVKASGTARTSIPFTLYKALREALMVGRRQGIFALLVDTTLMVSDFEIPVETFATERGNFHKQHVPLYQLDTFDVGLIGHQFSFDLHADPYHFLRMGRLLWKLLVYEYRDVSKAEEHPQDKLQLAEECLTGNPDKWIKN